MALTLDISPDMETLLRLSAAQKGQDATSYLLTLVQQDLNVDLSEHADLEDYASSVASIQAGLEDLNAGNSISFEDWCLREDARKKERNQQKQKAPEKQKAPVAEKAA